MWRSRGERSYRGLGRAARRRVLRSPGARRTPRAVRARRGRHMPAVRVPGVLARAHLVAAGIRGLLRTSRDRLHPRQFPRRACPGDRAQGAVQQLHDRRSRFRLLGRLHCFRASRSGRTSWTMILPATSLVPGEASGPVFALSQPLSFWGGFDATSGRIIDRSHPQVGARLSAHVLLMTAGRGSSSGSSVLAEAIRLRTAPCAIVLLTRDAIVTVGAIVATELYRSSCPVVLARDSDWPALAAASRLVIIASNKAASLAVDPEG